MSRTACGSAEHGARTAFIVSGREPDARLVAKRRGRPRPVEDAPEVKPAHVEVVSELEADRAGAQAIERAEQETGNGNPLCANVA